MKGDSLHGDFIELLDSVDEYEHQILEWIGELEDENI